MTAADDSLAEPVTITIARRVKQASEAEYEQLVREFVPLTMQVPGHLGVHVTKVPGELGLEYHVVIKFASRKQWRDFHDSPRYIAFREAIEPHLETMPTVAELSGLESWFITPTAPLRALPKWKMAIVTFVGVYPTSLALNLALGGVLNDAAVWLRVLVITSLMVALLTWVVMPICNLIFAAWLQAD